ncbi:MAG: tRNA (5-methylaminomethyl-2-thiouridine)(34)-methyltransferase MnmD [Bacteroidales bacterium]|nr:tRNA (5-methylaminomethyl-2-thiouridine)(34)-methyltransferase MnmD [Bacteroidales bacterium]
MMQLITTSDGSHTLFVPRLNEHYHSTFGALTESMHVYLQAGFESLAGKQEVRVFEVGFGTGLNTLLTCLSAVEKGVHTTYYTIESDPLEAELTKKLNYGNLLSGNLKPGELFTSIHQAPWNKTVKIHPDFSLHKIHASLIGYRPDFTFDLLYYDAFAPDKQAEMWSPDIFRTLFEKMNPGGILVTYCVKGEVKSMLRQAGFDIEKLPGPPGKREILRGRKRKT